MKCLENVGTAVGFLDATWIQMHLLLQKAKKALSLKLMWGFLYTNSQLLCALVSLSDNGRWSKYFNSKLLMLSRESAELPNSVNLMVCDPLVLILLYRFHFRSGSQATKGNPVAPQFPTTARKDFKFLSPLTHIVPLFCSHQFWLWSRSLLSKLINKLRSFLPDKQVEMACDGVSVLCEQDWLKLDCCTEFCSCICS